MFGILKPCFCGPQEGTLKSEWMSHYCDLCGSISSLYGVSKRMLVVFDVATLSWLFSSSLDARKTYPKFNCVKGGTLPYRKRHPEGLRKFLASFSVLASSVKLFDDQLDNPGLIQDLKASFAKNAHRNALLHAKELGFSTAEMQMELAKQVDLEARREPDLMLASEPTAKCYGQAASVIASQLPNSDITGGDALTIGYYLGRCIYLIDAFRDRKQDLLTGNYNPFNCASSKPTFGMRADKEKLMAVLEEVRPEIESAIKRLPDGFMSRWECVMRNFVNHTGLSGHDRLFMWCICPCLGGHVAATGQEVNDGCCKCCAWGCVCCIPCVAMIGSS